MYTWDLNYLMHNRSSYRPCRAAVDRAAPGPRRGRAGPRRAVRLSAAPYRGRAAPRRAAPGRAAVDQAAPYQGRAAPPSTRPDREKKTEGGTPKSSPMLSNPYPMRMVSVAAWIMNRHIVCHHIWMVRSDGRDKLSVRDRERIDTAIEKYKAETDAATLECQERRRAAQLDRDKVITDIILNGTRGIMACIGRYLGCTDQTVINMKKRVIRARMLEELGKID